MRAYSHDLKVFFNVVGKEPADVVPGDVLAFVSAQRRARPGAENVVRISEGSGREGSQRGPVPSGGGGGLRHGAHGIYIRASGQSAADANGLDVVEKRLGDFERIVRLGQSYLVAVFVDTSMNGPIAASDVRLYRPEKVACWMVSPVRLVHDAWSPSSLTNVYFLRTSG